MLRLLVFIIFTFLFSACSQGLLDGNIEKNLEATDKVYGRCDNPYRQFTEIEREICRGKVMAAGPDGEVGDPISLTDIIDKFNNPEKNVVYAGSSVNRYLWQGSLLILEEYPLQTVDSQGGLISTDWILNKELPNKRCQIKVNVITQEFISTGVRTKFICQNKDNDQWYQSNDVLIEEEKKITLKILEKALELSTIDNFS